MDVEDGLNGSVGVVRGVIEEGFCHWGTTVGASGVHDGDASATARWPFGDVEDLVAGVGEFGDGAQGFDGVFDGGAGVDGFECPEHFDAAEFIGRKVDVEQVHVEELGCGHELVPVGGMIGETAASAQVGGGGSRVFAGNPVQFHKFDHPVQNAVEFPPSWASEWMVQEVCIASVLLGEEQITGVGVDGGHATLNRTAGVVKDAGISGDVLKAGEFGGEAEKFGGSCHTRRVPDAVDGSFSSVGAARGTRAAH